jgi:hypothetical protein
LVLVWAHTEIVSVGFGLREVVMAWIEQTGECSWRVRYPRPIGGYGSVSGFGSKKAARDFAEDLESDRRRGRWLDPDGAKVTVAAWAARWVGTLDVETRTEENYRAYLRNHILPRWARMPLGGDYCAGGHRVDQVFAPALRSLDGGGDRDGVLDDA